MSIFEIVLQAPTIQASVEDVQAQRQWIETGTVSLDYIASRSGQSMSGREDPILTILGNSALTVAVPAPVQNVDSGPHSS